MRLPTDLGSPIWAATDRAMTQLKDEAGRRIILLFSDGDDTQDAKSTLPPPPPIAPTSFMNPCTAAQPVSYRSLDDVIKRASAEGVMVYAVSVTTNTLAGNLGGAALAKLSKETGTQYQRLGNYSEVKAVHRRRAAPAVSARLRAHRDRRQAARHRGQGEAVGRDGAGAEELHRRDEVAAN